jgi:hypothetical protein
MAALDRALALSESEHVALEIGEELDLDVAGSLDVALAEDAVVAERRLCLAACRRKGIVDLAGCADDAHSTPAASGSRLDDEGEAELGRVADGDDRNARCGSDALRLQLVAAGAKRFRGRTDPGELGRLHRLREVGVLREEAVTGMDRVCARLFRGADVLLREEVAGDVNGFVGRAGVE